MQFEGMQEGKRFHQFYNGGNFFTCYGIQPNSINFHKWGLQIVYYKDEKFIFNNGALPRFLEKQH